MVTIVTATDAKVCGHDNCTSITEPFEISFSYCTMQSSLLSDYGDFIEYTTLIVKDDKAVYSSQTIISTTEWKQINHPATLKQMNGRSQIWLLLNYAPLFLLSNEAYINCSAIPFDWCLKVMWHYYGPANRRENTPIHSCSEWSGPTCVFTRLWRPGESCQGGNSSSVAQPCCCSLGLLSQSNPLQQTEWPACAYAAVAVLVQVVSC